MQPQSALGANLGRTEERLGTPASEGWLWGQLPSGSTPPSMTASWLYIPYVPVFGEASVYILPQFSIPRKGCELKTKMTFFYEDAVCHHMVQ